MSYLSRYIKVSPISLPFILSAALVLGSVLQEARSFAEDETEPEVQQQDMAKVKKDLIQSGRLYYDSKKYEAAIKQWEEALVLEPENKKIKKYIRDAEAKLKKQAEKEERARRRKKDVQLISITTPPKEAIKILSLDDCVNIAVNNHLPLQIAQKNIKLGEMRCWEARRNLLPTITVRWEEADGRVNARRYVGKKQSIEGQQAIFHGGELYFTMKQAETNLKIVREEYNRIKNDLTLQVEKGYYTFAKAKENFKLQKDLKKEVDRIYDIVKKGTEAGAIAKLEFLNVASQQSQVGFQYTSGEGDVSIAELILKQTMNLNPKDQIEIEPRLEFKKIDIDSGRVLGAAFLNRPEMRINSLMVEYYKYEKSIAKAKGWPKVDLMGSWGLAKEEFAPEDMGTDGINRKLEQQWYGGFKASMPFWGSTGEISYTREQWVPVVSTVHGTEAGTLAANFKLWDNFKYYSDKQTSDIDFDRARQEFIKIKQDITLEAMESCFSYEKSLLQLETAANKVKYQESDLELAKLKRGMDEAQDSNVIDSMIKVAQEKFGYVQALTDCHIALATINKAIGVKNYFKPDTDVKSGGDVFNIPQ